MITDIDHDISYVKIYRDLSEEDLRAWLIHVNAEPVKPCAERSAGADIMSPCRALDARSPSLESNTQ